MMNEFFRQLQVRPRIVGKGEKRVGVRDSTIKTYWSKLNSFLEWLECRQVVEENPLKKVRVPEPHYDDHRALEKEAVGKIISAITQNSKNTFLRKRDLLMVSILLYCGLRRGELIGLQVRDINIDRRELTVRAETSKSRRSRILPINPILHQDIVDYLKERKEKERKSEYLLISDNNDRQLSLHGLKHWVNRLRTISGVRFHPHQFRHTFACMLVRSGASMVVIQKLMGHTDLRMTERYLRSLTVEDLREATNKLTLDNL